MSAELKINLLLLGKTGGGKSATGNTLLGRKCFNVSADATSGTKDVDFNFGTFEQYSVLVVDGPGLLDTELNQTSKDGNKDTARLSAQAEAHRAKELELVAKNMDKALAMCYGGVDAFLLVIKFGSRFTDENVKTVESLKTIFGPNYLDHVVVIMTGGDLFQDAMEEEDKNYTFHDWCQNKTGKMSGLYEQFRGRFVLFNNRTKDAQENRRQILELMRIVNGILDHGHRYDADCFKQADLERQKLIVKLKVPHLKFGIQEKAGLLTGEIEKLDQVKDLSPSQKADIERKLNALKNEILIEDKNFGLFQDMLELVERIHQNLNDVAELKRLGKELESTRTSKSVWGWLGSVATVAGGAICLLNPIVGACVAAGSATVSGRSYFVYGSKMANFRNKEDSSVSEVSSNAGLSMKYGADMRDKELDKTLNDNSKDTTRNIIQESTRVEALKIKEYKSRQKSVTDTKVDFNYLLIGKTGHGKSATGNSIVLRSVFKTNSSFEATASSVQSAVTKLDNYMIKVVDGPGIDCEDSRTDRHPETLTREMTKALASVNHRVDAFLLVIRFGSRFTSEDFESVLWLEKIFGDEFLKHVIVVVTGGDDFRDYEVDEKCGFQDWCLKQTGGFTKLLVACEDRCVLFNNKEKDEFKRLVQVKELLKVAKNLQQSLGPHCTLPFLQSVKSMRSLKEYKTSVPFVPDIHKQLRKDDRTKPSISSENEISEDISEKLKELAFELEDSQKVKQVWTKIATGASLAGVALGVVLPVLGALVAATGVVSIIAGRQQIDEKMESIRSVQQKIRKENNLPVETQEAKKTQ